MALRVASDAKVTKPWPKALEEARGILAKDCGAECLRILDTVVAPALNGSQKEQVFPMMCFFFYVLSFEFLCFCCNACYLFAR